jgi:hypothetical protein
MYRIQNGDAVRSARHVPRLLSSLVLRTRQTESTASGGSKCRPLFCRDSIDLVVGINAGLLCARKRTGLVSVRECRNRMTIWTIDSHLKFWLCFLGGVDVGGLVSVFLRPEGPPGRPPLYKKPSAGSSNPSMTY